MPTLINPFIPNQPVRPNEFVGRHREIRELEAALTHTKNGRPRHFLITGERGIGKTSFLDYIRTTARSYSADKQHAFNFIVVDVVVDGITSKLDLVKKIRLALDYELARTEPTRDFLGRAWSFIQRIEAAGVSLKSNAEPSGNDTILYDELGYSLIEIVRRSCSEGDPDSFFSSRAYDGVMILVDEADQAAPELDIGAFFKYLLELLRRHNCNKVVVGLAGLPNVVEVLLNSHRSSLRVFDELKLENLRREEVNELLDDRELLVQDSGYEHFRFTPKARELIFEMSGGHPHFVHQFGYCAVECDSDQVIDENDVITGAFLKRGAVDIIGDMYFRATYEAIPETSCARRILRLLAEETRASLTAAELCRNALISSEEIGEALVELVNSGLLECDSQVREYRLKHACFAYWLHALEPEIML